MVVVVIKMGVKARDVRTIADRNCSCAGPEVDNGSEAN